MKKSIAIDMDDTIADTVSRHIEWYHERFGVLLTKQDLHGKKIYDVVDASHVALVRQHPHQASFYENLPVMENAIDVIKELSESYEIYFASAAMEYPASFTPKYEWLRTHFPFVSDMNYIFCGFKGVLNCDYLVDDSSRHFKHFGGKGYLFDSPHNKNDEGFDRVNNWLEVRAKFL